MEQEPLLLPYVSRNNLAVSLFLYFPTIAFASFFRYREERAATPIPLPSPFLPGPLRSHHAIGTPARGLEAATCDLGTLGNSNATILPIPYPQASKSNSTPVPSRYAIENSSAPFWHNWGSMRLKLGMRSQEAGSKAGVARGTARYLHNRKENRYRQRDRRHPVCSGRKKQRFAKGPGGRRRNGDVYQVTVYPAFHECLAISGRGYARFHRASS